MTIDEEELENKVAQIVDQMGYLMLDIIQFYQPSTILMAGVDLELCCPLIKIIGLHLIFQILLTQNMVIVGVLIVGLQML